MPERLDEVTIRTSRGTARLPWSSREALLQEIRHLDSARTVVERFEAVGATRPIELDSEGKALLVDAIHVMGNNAGSLHKIPDGLFELRNALLDDLHDRGDT